MAEHLWGYYAPLAVVGLAFIAISWRELFAATPGEAGRFVKWVAESMRTSPEEWSDGTNLYGEATLHHPGGTILVISYAGAQLANPSGLRLSAGDKRRLARAASDLRARRAIRGGGS